MPALAVLLFACTTSCALAVELQVFPTAEEMPPMLTPEEVDRANSLLTALGLTSWLSCPLAGRVTSKMVTLADGYAYDLNRIVASCRDTNTPKSPHYRHLTIPTSLAFAFLNLDLMDIAKDIGSIAQSVLNRKVPATIRRWIGSPLLQPIWICADGRSRIVTSFQYPFTIEQLGMLLTFDNGEFCFRNIRLEQVVDEICRRVDCGTGDAPHIRESLMRMGTVREEPDARQSLSISSLLSASVAASSSRPLVADQHRLSIDTFSSGTSTAVPSPTSPARSSSGSPPLANHYTPNGLLTSVGTDDIVSAAWATIADAIPWPSESEVQPAPSLPYAISSAWAATIAHTRDLDKKPFWSRDHLYSTTSDSFYAAMFWANHYRTTFKPADMELPPKPTATSDDMRGWQASCYQFFQAAEDFVVNAIPGQRGNPKVRYARALKRLVTQLGLVTRRKRRRITWSDHNADTIPWPSMSAMTPAPLLPPEISSAWAATIAYTRSLDDEKRWNWANLTRADMQPIYDALFWAHQYRTTWKPPGMSLPPKPACSDGFSGWQASCYRFFKAAEDLVVKVISEREGVGEAGIGGISRGANPFRRRLTKLGLSMITERKRRKTVRLDMPSRKRS